MVHTEPDKKHSSKRTSKNSWDGHRSSIWADIYLDKTKRTFDEQLLKEIIASALMLVITKLKQEDDYWEESLIGNDLKRGSVSEAVYYFVNTLEWDVSSMETLSLSIRKFLDQRL